MKRITFISQSGNVMKSSLAQALAIEATRNQWSVVLCDTDLEHQTSAQWMSLREQRGIEPCCPVLLPKSTKQAAQIRGNHDLLTYDAPSRATQATPTIAKTADLIIQPVPTGSTKDADLALMTFHQLLAAGIPAAKMKFILTRAGTQTEVQKTRNYLCGAKINDRVVGHRYFGACYI